jgi:ubiquinone/menaquinone biosynthesis C-methylase UbiE
MKSRADDMIKEEMKARYNLRPDRVENSLFTIHAGADDAAIINLHKNLHPTLKYFRTRKIETALDLGNFSSDDHLLEVGCNLGQFTVTLAEHGFRVTGIDLANTVIVAQRNAELLGLKKVEFQQADVENLEVFPDQTFDGVVSFSTLRYVPNLPLALREIYRVTKPGGAVALDFPNRYCPWFRLLKKRFGQGDHIHDNFFTGRRLTRLLEDAGFRHIRIRKVMFIHYTFPQRFLPLYRLIDRCCENMWGIRKAAAILFVSGRRV